VRNVAAKPKLTGLSPGDPSTSTKGERMTFAEILKARREAAGLTRMGLAGRADVTPSAITLYEQGRRGPTWAVVQRLADALGVSTEAFRDNAPEDGSASQPEPATPKPKGKK
jgi:transcriptional regulator with XRE-family HTH domain